MEFIQIIESTTDDADGMKALVDEWAQATEGKRTARRSFVARDRNDPRHFVTIVFFDSYESAMENSKMPETQELAGKLAAMVDGAPTFHDLDVLEDRS